MRLNYFNFKEYDGKYLITNDFGHYAFLDRKEFKGLLKDKSVSDPVLRKELLDKKFIYEESDLLFLQNNRMTIRETRGYVALATSLHIFVVTTACNMNCVYCQANNGKKCSNLFMTKEIAEKAVKIALESPTRCLSFEFQGGEPLLNFEIIKYIVELAEKDKGDHEINYNVVSNLTLLTDEMIAFFKSYEFGISTSLDGSEEVHNSNRMLLDGTGTFDKVVNGVDRLRGSGLHVGAIETTTRKALSHAKDVIAGYLSLGFDSIFVRPLTPLGRAAMNWDDIGYTPEEYLVFYADVMNELIKVNKAGRNIREDHSSIFLEKMHGTMVNYMELRSPCGAGIGQLAYYADGNIYTCDEARMVSEMGDKSFLLGNVFKKSYPELIKNGTCKAVCAASTLETIPSCCDCAYQPYCGVCPVVNYALQGDVIEKYPRGYRCKINSGMIDYLFGIIKSDDKESIEILESWSN